MRIPGALDAAALPADGAVEASCTGQGRGNLERLNQMREEGRPWHWNVSCGSRMEHVQQPEGDREASARGATRLCREIKDPNAGADRDSAEPERILQEAGFVGGSPVIFQEELVRLRRHVKHFSVSLTRKAGREEARLLCKK